MIAKGGVSLKYFPIVLVCVAGSYAVDCDGFQYQPLDQQVPEGAIEATFYCLFDGSISVAWFLNETSINEIFESPTPPVAISRDTVTLDNFAVSRLTIGALRGYNTTVVTCQAYFLTSTLKVCSATGVLLIRAPPGPADNLALHSTSTELQLTWEHSPITTDYPIQYCVDVAKVVGGMEMLVHAECIVNQTSYVFSSSESEPDPSDLFQFTITPRYSVNGARNGTSTYITGYFIGEPSMLSQDSMTVGIAILRDQLVTLTITFHNAESWITGGQKVTEFLVEVVLDSGQLYICSPDQPVMMSSSTLSLDANCSLPVQRLGSVTVTAINCVGNSSLTAPLSTHFLQNIRTWPCRSNHCQVEVIYDIVGDPEVVVGSLIMIYKGEDEIHYFTGRHLDNARRGSVSVSGLMKGQYNLLVFPLNKSGLPSRFPANLQLQSEVINVSAPANDTGGDHDERPVHLKGFKYTGGGCFQCNFWPNSSASHCAVIVHTLDEVVNVSLFERRSDRARASGCIVVEPPALYYAVGFAYINNAIHGQPYNVGRVLLQGGKGTPTSVIMIVVVTLVAVAAVVAPCVIIPSAYVGRQKYNARRYGDIERRELNHVRDAQIVPQGHHVEMELRERLRAVTSMEELLSCFRDINPDWPAVCDELIALNKHELAGKVYTDYILPKLQKNEQADSGRYTLTTSTGSAGVEGDGVPTQDSEGDKFGDPQSEHGRSGVSSVVSHISDPSKDLLAESDLERVVHKQATGEADDGSNYDDMLQQQQTLSTIPTEGSHNSIQNERELYPAAAEEGNKSDVIPFINNPTN